MNGSDNHLQHAALSALSTIRMVLALSFVWFLVIAVLSGMKVMVAGANVIFVLLALLSAIAALFSIVLGVSLLRETVCRGAAGVWMLATEHPRFRLQILWLLLSGFLFAFSLMA